MQNPNSPQNPSHHRPPSHFWRWFIPGLGLKRWMFVILTGITLLGLALAILIIEIYRTEANNSIIVTFLDYASLRVLPRLVRILILSGLGIGMIGFGFWRLNGALLTPFLRPGQAVIDQISNYRRHERGPRIVAIGGGHGLSALLRGLKAQTSNITAIVTVADDGGSSGRLRKSLGILPPGDIRNCLAALSNNEALLTQLFQYRFSGSPDLEGHSFGNLFITALTDITGSFEEAVVESGRALSVGGRVLPSTLHPVHLVADMLLPHQLNEVRVQGESKIPEMAGLVRRVWLEPNNPPAFPPVLQAILNADMIVIGPGSIYTSLLPNLLVPDLLAAIRASRAIKIYVCNIATQPGETDLYTSYDHVRALEDHAGQDLFDVVLCNDNNEGELGPTMQWVGMDEKNPPDSRNYYADLLETEHPGRHDPDKLVRVLMELFYEHTGPLRDKVV